MNWQWMTKAQECVIEGPGISDFPYRYVEYSGNFIPASNEASAAKQHLPNAARVNTPQLAALLV